MDKHYFAVAPDMVTALSGIGITVTDHALYLTVTSRGAIRVVPVRQANSDGEQNEYDRTKEIGLIQAMRRMGALVHRPGEPLLQGVSRAGRAVH